VTTLAQRQSGDRFRLTPPDPLERDVHEACASALDKLLLWPALWFTYPAGAAELSPQQQSRFSRVGLKRGLPDIWILHRGLWLIELKRRGAQLSKTRIVRTKRGSPRILIGQDQMFPALLATGAVNDIAVCYDVDEVLAALDRWGIPRRPTVKW
jgi:hypothetical protein